MEVGVMYMHKLPTVDEEIVWIQRFTNKIVLYSCNRLRVMHLATDASRVIISSYETNTNLHL
jgi:hypothetical protein